MKHEKFSLCMYRLLSNFARSFSLFIFNWTINVRHPFLQPIFFDPFMNIVGATMIKYVNNFANGLTNFPTYDLVIQVVLFDADNLYTRHILYARL